MNRISELKILQGVPFEKDTNTSMTFDSLSEQTQYFTGFAIKSFNHLSFVKGFLYKKVCVECDIEDVYSANYLMWKNNDGKWFYAYITGFEMKSEVATEITFDMDYIQSYMGDIVFQENDIERQHTLDDDYELKINETSDPLIQESEYIIDKSDGWREDEWQVAILYKPNLFLEKLESAGSGWTKTDSGGTLVTKDNIYVKSKDQYIADTNYSRKSYLSIDTIYTGARCKYIKINQYSKVNDIEDELTILETTGYQVIKVLMVPKNFEVHRSGTEETIDVQSDTDIGVARNPYYDKLNQTGDRGALNGYIPVNNKLYFYPFVKLQVDNLQGKTKDYKYERFATNALSSDKKPQFRITEFFLETLSQIAHQRDI